MKRLKLASLLLLLLAVTGLTVACGGTADPAGNCQYGKVCKFKLRQMNRFYFYHGISWILSHIRRGYRVPEVPAVDNAVR